MYLKEFLEKKILALNVYFVNKLYLWPNIFKQKLEIIKMSGNE